MAKQEPDRGYIYWTPNARTEELREQVLTMVNSYGERGLPAPTPRDVFYDVVAVYGHPKTKELARAVYRILRKARRAKLIRFDQITDDSEAHKHIGGYESPEAFFVKMQRYANGYMRHFENNQPVHVELFTEGKGKVQQLTRVAKDYHIAVRAPGGYDSIAPKRGLALRAAKEWAEDRPTVVLHMGDFDPDGLEIFEVFKEDVCAFLEDHIYDDPEDVITFKRIAVNLDQVPPERRATFDLAEKNERDTRAPRWPHKYEAQLESLGVPRILEIAREEIEAVLDLDQIEEDKLQSQAERQEIKAKIRRLSEDED